MAAQSVKIPVELQLNNIKSQIDELQKALNGVKTGTTAYKNLNNVLQQLERQFTATQVESKKAFSNSGQIEHFSRGIERLGSLAQIFQERLEEVGFKDLNIDLTSFNAATKKVKDLEENISKLKQYKVGDLFKDTDVEKLAARLNIKIDTKTTLEELREDFATVEDELDKQKKALENELATIQAKKQNFTKNFGDFADTSGLEKEFKKLADANTKVSFLPSEQSNATDKIIKSLGLEKVALPKISKANTIPEYINDVISKIKEGIANYNKGINETIKDAQVTKIKLEKALLKLQELEDKGQKNISGSEAISLTSLFGVRITQDTISKNKKTLNNLLVAEIDKINNQPKLISLDDSAIQTAVTAAANGIKTDANLQAKAFVQAVQNFLQLRDSSINPKVLEMNAGEDVTTYISRIISTLKAEGIELENLQNQIIADIAEKSQLANEASQAVITVNQEIWQQDKTIALEEQELDKAKIALQGVENASRKVGEAINHSAAPAVNNISENIRQEFVPRIGEAQDKLENLRSSAEKLESIQNSIKQWFGFNEVINLTKNAIRGAIEHISKLDDVMTEIAVVTDMTQKELWGQISTYSAMAQKYGATTQGVYEVSQLYYQQGLQTAEVMRLTEETLKMAKIANLEYADATDYMTVAIRGFKLEMTDAQRVVDVYSNIAAVTASDTEELAVAMSKTASSAEAVGSSFENTTAMIALMVETTREAPQNIGSAMKSIISRYGEMTSDPTKLVDSEGEEMSLNRVDKALKTVGITLQNTNGQFREFDDVILELSAKWDTIDKNTQRYIATIMAGNRQQSRFLALVGNYERLSELYEEAANSQDAATLQTLKTMDSIETKINQLKTTFQEFYTNTGIEELIKGVLDFITKVIEKIDGIPKAFGKIPIAALGMVGSLISTGKNGALLLMRGIFGVIDSVLPEVEVEGVKIGEYLKKGIVKGAEGTGEEIVNKVKLTKTKTNWGIALGSLGMIISSASLALGDLNTQVGRTTSGILQLGWGFASAFGQILTGNYIGAAITLFSTITSSISTMIETTEEKIDRLKKAMEETSNQTILAKDELKTLEDYRKKLEKLTKERYNSDEAYQEWLDLNNEIVNKYPDLLDYMDNEGNLIASLGKEWEETRKAKQKYYETSKAEAVAALNYYGDPNASFLEAGGTNPYPKFSLMSGEDSDLGKRSLLFFERLIKSEIENLQDFKDVYSSFIAEDLSLVTTQAHEEINSKADIFFDTFEETGEGKGFGNLRTEVKNAGYNYDVEDVNSSLDIFYEDTFLPIIQAIQEGQSKEQINTGLADKGLQIKDEVYAGYKLMFSSTEYQFGKFAKEVQKAVFNYVDELDNYTDDFSIDTQFQQDLITDSLSEEYIKWLVGLEDLDKQKITEELEAQSWEDIENGRMGEVFQYWIESVSEYESQILEGFSNNSSLLSVISQLSKNKQKELDQIYLNAANYTLSDWLTAIENIIGETNLKINKGEFEDKYEEQTSSLYEEQKNKFNELEDKIIGQSSHITSENLTQTSLQQLFNLQETANFSDDLIVLLGRNISKLNSEKQEAFNNILSNANTDLTTLSGYYSFLQQLSEQNIVLDQNTLDQIRSSINPNWAIETELALENLSAIYTSLQDNFVKATEGLNLNEAIKFANTYEGVSFSDFNYDKEEKKWVLAGKTLEEIGNSIVETALNTVDNTIHSMETEIEKLPENSPERQELEANLKALKEARDYIPEVIAEESKSVAAETFKSLDFTNRSEVAKGLLDLYGWDTNVSSVVETLFEGDKESILATLQEINDENNLQWSLQEMIEAAETLSTLVSTQIQETLEGKTGDIFEISQDTAKALEGMAGIEIKDYWTKDNTHIYQATITSAEEYNEAIQEQLLAGALVFETAEENIAALTRIYTDKNKKLKTELDLQNNLVGISEDALSTYITLLSNQKDPEKSITKDDFEFDEKTGTYTFKDESFSKLENLTKEQQRIYWETLIENISAENFEDYLSQLENLGIPNDFKYLALDAGQEYFNEIISLITSGIEGTLSNEEAQKLTTEAATMGFEFEGLTFTPTENGLQLEDASTWATKFYNHYKKEANPAAKTILESFYSELEKEISDAAKILERENEIEKTSLNLKNKLTGLSEKDIVEYATKLGLDINYFIWDALTGTYYFDARHFDKLGNLSQEQQLAYWNSLLDNIKETDYDKYLAATTALGVPPEFQYLIKDAQNELFESIISSITSAIGGGASYEEANQLIKEYNLDLSSDFIETADGLKITQNAVLQIYNDLKVTKPLAAQIVLDNLTESIMESEEGLNDIYQVEEKIRKIDEEINNAKTSDSRKKILQDELTLAKNIHKELLAAGDTFNFMEQDLPTGMTNPLSAWEGLGQAFEVLDGEDFKAGYIDYTDLYNMISMMDEAGIDLKNVATNFNGDAVEASELMKAAAAAMVSVDGEVFVDLTKLGETFKLNADGMKEGIADGLEVFAQSQIELLDSQIAFLETIVAQEKVYESIDSNADKKIDLKEFTPMIDAEGISYWSKQQKQLLEYLKKNVGDFTLATGETLNDLIDNPVLFNSLDKKSQEFVINLINALNPFTNKENWGQEEIQKEFANFMASYYGELTIAAQTQSSLIDKGVFIPIDTELEEGLVSYKGTTYENIEAAYQQYLIDQGIKTAELPEVQATASQVTVSTKDGEFVFTTPEGEELTVEELIAKLNLDDTAALETLSAVQTALDTLTLPDHVLTFLQQAVTKVKDYASAANSISQLAVDRIERLKSNINNISTQTKTLTVNLQVSSSGGVSVASVGGSQKSKGNVASISLAQGNAKAKGTLMGELGPELYATGGHYYVAGQNGAEFVDLPDDAIVFNHLQTRRLLENGSINGTGTAITSEKKAVALATGNTSGPAMASASDALNQLIEIRAMWQSLLNKSAKDLGKKAGGGSGGSGGGGGGSDEDNKAFIHDLERWYNLLRQIEKLEQQITYEQAKRANMQSGYKYSDSLQKELTLLKKQQAAHQKLSDLQKDYYDKRRKDLLSTDYSKVFTYDQDGLMQYVDGKDRGLDILATLNATDENGKAIYTLAEQLAYLRKVGFDTKVLETNADGTKAEDEEQMLQNFWDGVDGWMDELDSLYDSYNESMTSVQESIEAQMEIQQEYIDNQLTVEEKLLQAIIDREQAEIDRLEKEKEVLEEATSEYIEGLNNALEREKEMYEKNDTSAETSRLQRQLAILQRSGGSAAEIRSLQDQIDSRLQDAYFQEQQDQIDAIQEASNNQLEKMQEQIDIMTEALEYQKENGLLWTEVYEMMNLWTPDQMLQFIEEFTKSYKENSDLQNQEDSEETQKQLEIYKAGEANKERDEAWADFYKNLNYEEEFKNKHAVGAQAAFNEAYAKGGLDEAKKAAEQYYKDNEKPKAPTDNNEKPIEPENKPTIESGGSNSGKTESEKKSTKKTSYRRGDSGSIVKKIQESLNKRAGKNFLVVDGVYGAATENAVKRFQRDMQLAEDGIAGPATLKKLGITAFKTGGLVDFTGPAWVDGTKSKPEAFLSASDTAMLKSKIFSNSDGSLKALVAALEEITNNTSRYSTEMNSEQIIIQNAQVNIQPGVISNDYSARRAGEMALEEMVKIARKTTNRVVSR